MDPAPEPAEEQPTIGNSRHCYLISMVNVNSLISFTKDFPLLF
jgi:hypothetical protein